MKIALLGYGKMGKSIEKIGKEQGHSFPLKISASNANNLKKEILQECEVAIEFSTPDSAVKHIKSCFEVGVPVVCGTTGWLDQKSTIEQLCRNINGTFLYSSNFSLGVNLFLRLVNYASQQMASFKDYHIRLNEVHHTQKKDAPSGTAISIAEAVMKHSGYQDWELTKTPTQSASSDNILPIHANRKDEVIGTHELVFASAVDEIVLRHHAFSREGFSFGALLAAQYIHNKKGVFTMEDVLT